MGRILKRPWYSEFVDCVLPHTEAPKNYLLWSAFSVLAGVLKNKVFYKEGLYTIYPNQFIVLTGPPSVGKGTAIKFAWDMVKKKPTFPLVNIISNRATAERMIEMIAEGWALPPKIIGNQAVQVSMDRSCTLFAPELESLLTASEWMLPFLCDVWQEDTYSYETKNKGSNQIKNMCLSLIGATVPDYVRGIEKSANTSVAGGFTSRCIFVYADKKSKDLPEAQPIEENAKNFNTYQSLVHDLEHISTLQGQYKIDTDASLAFRAFYSETAPLADDSDAILHFKGRMKAHVYKLAILLTVSKHDNLIIRGQEMRDAIFLVREIKNKITRVFRGIGSSELAEPTARVQLCIEKYGMVSKKELLKVNHAHMTTETLDRILTMLLAIGFCRTHSTGGTVYYLPITKQQVQTNGHFKGVKP